MIIKFSQWASQNQWEWFVCYCHLWEQQECHCFSQQFSISCMYQAHWYLTSLCARKEDWWFNEYTVYCHWESDYWQSYQAVETWVV